MELQRVSGTRGLTTRGLTTRRLTMSLLLRGAHATGRERRPVEETADRCPSVMSGHERSWSSQRDPRRPDAPSPDRTDCRRRGSGGGGIGVRGGPSCEQRGGQRGVGLLAQPPSFSPFPQYRVEQGLWNRGAVC